MSSNATKKFVLQRFTSVIQVPLVLWLTISIAIHAGDSLGEFRAWVSQPLTALLLIAFILSVFFHMHLGMEEVIDDYIHKKNARSSLQKLNVLFALVLGAISFFSVIIISLI